MLKIRIHDDEQDRAHKWCSDLKALVGAEPDVDVLSSEDIAGWLTQLVERRLGWREMGQLGDQEGPFDDIDVLVIDFDLLNTSSQDLPLPIATGEQVAYLVRCFSACKYIIGMNLPTYAGNGYDLTLRGHLESYADLNIASEQLANPGLWTEQFAGYRPWHWPIVPDYLLTWEERVKDAREGLDNPVYEVLGLPEQLFEQLPRSIGEFLGPNCESVTVREFALASRNGLMPKDSPPKGQPDPNVLARIAAARLSKWIERRLLPGQDILIDAPHLIERFPSLLGEDRQAMAKWNEAIRLGHRESSVIGRDLIGEFAFAKHHWVSRPVWLWRDIRENEAIREIREPWQIQTPKWVFCEDASRFCDEFVEFRAELESPYSSRYIRSDQSSDKVSVDYRPKSRLLVWES